MVHRIGAEQVGPVGQVALFPPEMRDYDSWCVGGIGISAGPTRETMTGESEMPESPRPAVVPRAPGDQSGRHRRRADSRAAPRRRGRRARRGRGRDRRDRVPPRSRLLGRSVPRRGRRVARLAAGAGLDPQARASVDVEGILLAVAVGCRGRAPSRPCVRAERDRARPDQARRRCSRSRWARALRIWWAIPFLRQSVAGRLRLLLPGWDNPTHLNFLRLNIKLGSFVTVQPNSPSGARVRRVGVPAGLAPDVGGSSCGSGTATRPRAPARSSTSTPSPWSLTAGIAVMHRLRRGRAAVPRSHVRRPGADERSSRSCSPSACSR